MTFKEYLWWSFAFQDHVSNYQKLIDLMKRKFPIEVGPIPLYQVVTWGCPCGGRTPSDELNCNQCGEPNPETKVSTTPDAWEPPATPEPPKQETWRDRPPLL